MKRISTFVALLVLICTVAQARNSQRYRVHYNPYAFSYHNNGLVSGGVRYSMHAFSYHNSGLVQEYSTNTTPAYGPFVDCATPRRSSSIRTRRPSVIRSNRCRISAEQRREIEEKDGLNVIRQFLVAQGYKDVRVKHHLSIENQTIGAAVLVADSNLIITYTNAEALAALAKETGHKKLAVERLEQRMADTTGTVLADGGQVYAIDASSRDQILLALEDCDSLDLNTSTPTAVYAKN